MPHSFAKDLTEGGVAKNLVAFALPLMASTLLQALYNVTDMLIVGLFTDAAGLSGVAIGGMLTVLVTNVVVGLASGGTIMIAQSHGAKRYDDERKAIGTLLGGCLVLAAGVTLVLVAWAGPVVKLLDAPSESYAQARDYLRICMGGAFFIFGYNAMSAIMRGLGDSKRPLLFVAVSTIANVILDILMVGVFRQGAAGAAWATVASQGLSLLLSIIYLTRRGFRFHIGIDGAAAARILRIGIPVGLQQLIVQLSFTFLMTLVNGYGVAASAAVGVCAKVNSFAILPGLAMSAAIAAMAGQNIGAGRYDRAQETMIAGLKIMIPTGLAVFAVVNVFTADIIGIFSRDREVVDLGILYMRYVSVDALVATIFFCFGGLLNGAGKTMITLLTSIVSSIILRAPLAWIFARSLSLGLRGVGMAVALAPFGAFAVVFGYVVSGRWRKPPITTAGTGGTGGSISGDA